MDDNQRAIVLIYESRRSSADVTDVMVFDDRDRAVDYFNHCVDAGIPCQIMMGKYNPNIPPRKPNQGQLL